MKKNQNIKPRKTFILQLKVRKIAPSPPWHVSSPIEEVEVNLAQILQIEM
jgi:hypothetical protein